MSRNHGWLVCLMGVVTGCVSPDPQVSDLSTPPAPRLAWVRTSQAQPVASLVKQQDLVIREHRFVSHSAELNSDGEEQLQRILTALKNSSARIVIESSSGTPVLPVTLTGQSDAPVKLDLQRRQHIIQKLLLLGIPDAEKRVTLEPIST